MSYAIQKVADVVVVDLEGDMWGGWDAVELKNTVTRMVEEGERKFLVDLSRVKHVNSAGTGILVACLSTLKTADGWFAVCSPSQRTRRVFSIVGVNDVLPIYGTRLEALKEFGVA